MDAARPRIKKILLMRVDAPAVTNSNHPHQFYPPFLLKYIQALLEREDVYEIKLLDCWVNHIPLHKLARQIDVWSPDLMVVFMTCLNANQTLRYISLIKKNKDRDTLVIGVGPETTFNYQRYFQSNLLDFVLPGDSEEEVCILIKKINQDAAFGKLDLSGYKIFRQPSIIEDLDSLPLPCYSLNELKSYRFLYPVRMHKKVIWGHLLGSRGCPHECLFCSQITRETYGNRLRFRSAADIVDEIEFLLKSGANFISFADDDFTASSDYVLSVCREITRRGLAFKWTAQGRVDEVDYSLLKIMQKAGCHLLAFGVESGAAGVIRMLRKNQKNIDWVNKAKDVFRYCAELNIATIGLFIIGSPAETEKDVAESTKLARDLKPDLIQVHFFTLYPGSEAYKKFNHKLKDQDTEGVYHHAAPSVNLSDIEMNELKSLRNAFYRRVIFEPYFILRHSARYFIFYLCNLSVLYTLLRKTFRMFSRGSGNIY